jgi:hypothetical protein
MLSGQPVIVNNIRRGRKKISCLCACLMAFVIGGTTMAIIKILNAQAAANLTATPTVSDLVVTEPTTVLPLDVDFIEEALRALENRA